MTPRRVIVVGAGVGGLCAAIRLAKIGNEVTIFERSSDVGGKLASRALHAAGCGDFRFDTGPSLLTLPHVFTELDVDIAPDLLRLEQPFHYTFADGAHLDVFDDAERTRQAFADFAPGAGPQWDAMYRHGQRVWEVSEYSFFGGPMESPRALLRRMKSWRDPLAVDPLRTLDERSRRLFVDARLQQWLDRYATYSGSSPFRVPASVSCIPYVEQQFGSWHVRGGVAMLAGKLAARARSLGVEIITDAEVTRLTHDGNKATGVALNRDVQGADIVLVNADAEIFYKTLLPNAKRLRRAIRAGRSTSGFAMLLGLRGVSDNLAHHNVLFSHDYRNEFAEMEIAGLAAEPTIYSCVASRSDSALAPANCEGWFVLANVAAGATADWSSYGSRIIERLGIAERVLVREDITPQDIEARSNAPAGAIYGTSSNGRMAAFFRAANRGPLRGVYLVGGSTHPGGGLPLVALSARIVAQMIQDDSC